jgi:hypothetical protein
MSALRGNAESAFALGMSVRDPKQTSRVSQVIDMGQMFLESTLA